MTEQTSIENRGLVAAGGMEDFLATLIKRRGQVHEERARAQQKGEAVLLLAREQCTQTSNHLNPPLNARPPERIDRHLNKPGLRVRWAKGKAKTDAGQVDARDLHSGP